MCDRGLFGSQSASHIERMGRKPTANMLAILAVMPDDGTAISQTEIYARIGNAEGVGAILHAMRKRGLIEGVGETWNAGSSFDTWRKVIAG